MFGLHITNRKLEKIATELGADCPVFIKNKPVYATGIGNEFTPVKLSLKGYFLLLVKPDIHVSTPEAYSLVVPEKPVISLLESIQSPVKEWVELIKNDFENRFLKNILKSGKLKINCTKREPYTHLCQDQDPQFTVFLKKRLRTIISLAIALLPEGF